jgi:hypothetical protein
MDTSAGSSAQGIGIVRGRSLRKTAASTTTPQMTTALSAKNEKSEAGSDASASGWH